MDTLPNQIDGKAELINTASRADADLASKLRESYEDAKNSMRRVIAFGLFLWDLKENHIKHGEFGQWLQANAPEFVSTRVRDGKTVLEWRTLQHYMDLTKKVLKVNGIQIRNALRICQGGQIMMQSDKELDPDAQELKNKICITVDNKSQRQLMWDFGDLEPKKKQHHPRKSKSADEQLSQQVDADTELVQGLIGDLTLLRENGGFARITDAIRMELTIELETTMKYLREVKAGKTPGKQKKASPQ